MTSIPFMKEDAQGDLHFGKQGRSCPHCGTPYIARQFTMPRTGRPFTAHYPSDTCCRTRAVEVVNANKFWASRYENLARQTDGYAAAAYREEAANLNASTRDITVTMRKRQEGVG